MCNHVISRPVRRIVFQNSSTGDSLSFPTKMNKEGRGVFRTIDYGKKNRKAIQKCPMRKLTSLCRKRKTETRVEDENLSARTKITTQRTNARDTVTGNQLKLSLSLITSWLFSISKWVANLWIFPFTWHYVDIPPVQQLLLFDRINVWNTID